MLHLFASRRFGAALAVAAACLALGSGRARAQIGSDRYSAYVIDARSGNALIAANPDVPRYPASLTKMMTLYMTFEALREGRLFLDSRLAMSETAAEMPPSKLGLPIGTGITVEGAILAVITKSANDVAALLGETLGGGSEQRFGQMMTLKARALGMSNTTFRNASGLPDPDQMTTARDMATLGRRLILDFPERYGYFSTIHTRVSGVPLRSHNRMLDSYEGADGIKTGYIRDSGFNIVTSAVRPKPNGERVRLISAVFGGSSWYERDQHTASLLDEGFERMGVPASVTPSVAVARAMSPGLMSRAMAATITPRLAPPVIADAKTRNGRRAVVIAAPSRAAPAPVASATRGTARVQQVTTTLRRPDARPPHVLRLPARTAATPNRTAAARQTRVLEQGDGGRTVRVKPVVREASR